MSDAFLSVIRAFHFQITKQVGEVCQLKENINFRMIQLTKVKDSVSMVQATALAV